MPRIGYFFSEYAPTLNTYDNGIPIYFVDGVNVRYDLQCGYSVAFMLPANIIDSDARATMRDFVRNNPDFSSPVWCKHSDQFAAPYIWYGFYFATNGRMAISTTRFDCPHCAYKAAIDAGRQPTSIRLMFVENGGDTLPADYIPRPQPIEIVGETPPMTTTTIKDGVMPEGTICSNCGQFGHNSSTCHRGPKQFLKIGVELEGRYVVISDAQRIANNMGADYSGDGSIHQSPESDATPYEFKTKPGNLRETISQVMALYPDESDASCGMHIHVSFNVDVLTLLNSKAFYKYFADRWSAWGTRMNLAPDSSFFKRLHGENDYCNVNEEEYINMVNMDRYHQINFNAWAKCKTVECRLLPMFRRSSLAIAAIQELICIYEDYLADPESHGFVWPSPKDIAIDKAYLKTESIKESFELEIPELKPEKTEYTLELAELLPPANGMIRIALPVNHPITVEVLANRLKTAKAA